MAKRGRWGDEPLSIILGEPCLAPLDLLLWLGASGMTSRRKDVVCCLRRLCSQEASVPHFLCRPREASWREALSLPL